VSTGPIILILGKEFALINMSKRPKTDIRIGRDHGI